MNRDSDRVTIHRKHVMNSHLSSTSELRQRQASHAEGLGHLDAMTIGQSYEQAKRRNETRQMNPELLKNAPEGRGALPLMARR